DDLLGSDLDVLAKRVVFTDVRTRAGDDSKIVPTRLGENRRGRTETAGCIGRVRRGPRPNRGRGLRRASTARPRPRVAGIADGKVLEHLRNVAREDGDSHSHERRFDVALKLVSVWMTPLTILRQRLDQRALQSVVELGSE